MVCLVGLHLVVIIRSHIRVHNTLHVHDTQRLCSFNWQLQVRYLAMFTRREAWNILQMAV